VNSINITGRLVKDAEIKFLESGSQVASFTIVHDVLDRNKEKQGMFFDCSCWGKRSEVVAEYFKKGGTVSVVGKLEPVYVKDGKGYLKVNVSDFTLPPRLQSDETQGGRASAPASSTPNNATRSAPLTAADFDEESIPF
jgi:single stranded DNA-binding protein